MGVAPVGIGDEFGAPGHSNGDSFRIQAHELPPEPFMKRAVLDHCSERLEIELRGRALSVPPSAILHGVSTAFPKTFRSIRSVMASLTRVSGRTQCLIGFNWPLATRRRSSIWSSRVQPLLPIMLNSNDQM